MNVCEVRLDKLRLEFGNYRHVLVPFLPTVLAKTGLLYTHGEKQWYFVTKSVLTYCQNCSSDREKNFKFEAEGREFEFFLR